MGESRVERKKRGARMAVCLCVISVCLMVVATTARHHPWIPFVGIGVEVLVVGVMLREVVSMRRGA